MITNFSQNCFDANVQAFSGLLNGNSFIGEFEIFILLVAVHCDTALSGRQCLWWATPTLISYKFLYYS
jgi:hypothetical protein